jgi:N-acetylneuraminate synthase
MKDPEPQVSPMPEISFELCQAIEPHARQLLAWRNDPATLAASFHREPQDFQRFWQDYRDTYFRTRPHPVFVLADGRRVGFLRFRPMPHHDGLAGAATDISIVIAPESRGRKLGHAALLVADSHLRAEGIDTVYAEIRVGNETSRRMFEAAGYEALCLAEKLVADTGERAPILRFVRELITPYWRRGRVFVIAEAGSNWRLGEARRDRAMARALVEVAAEAGADAVKFQTYRPETVYVANAGQSDYLADAGIKEDIGAIFADLAMPYELLPEIAAYSRECGVTFMSTGFSTTDFAAIDPFVEVHKLASYENGHVRLLDRAAAAGKPLVMSTGASGDAEIAWAVERYRAKGGRDLCVLQCTAKYPAPLAALNLATIPAMRRRFGVAVGLSDHSRDPVTAPVGAVALGARCIEKHYTLHNALPGPDHAFALTPDELKLMVRKVREAEDALGSALKEVTPEEQELAAFARRGVQAVRSIQRGEPLREGDNIDILRPGKQRRGVEPRFLEAIEGRAATRDIAAGDGLQPGDWA